MKPILYLADETNFSSNGLGQFSEAISVTAKEIANSEFTLEIIYPCNGFLYEYINNSLLIKAKPNDKDEPHVFRIYDWELNTYDNTIAIFASSITDDLGNDTVSEIIVKDSTPSQAMLQFNKYLQANNKRFSFQSDITTKSSTEWLGRSILNCIAGEEGSLLHYWGGEIKRTNRIVSLNKRRGRDYPVTIRQGKSLNGFQIKHSTRGMVTRILPYRMVTEEWPEGKDKPKGYIAPDPKPEFGTFVSSKFINNYAQVYDLAVDFTNEDGVESLKTMNAKAKDYFKDHPDIDKPSVNIEIDLLELSGADEYKDFKDFERIGLFDKITVYSSLYKIEIEAKVNAIEYDVLNEKNISVEVGSQQTGFAQGIKDGYTHAIQGAVGQSNSTLKQLVMIAANGKNKVFNGTADPNVAGINGEENDIYYREYGEERELWIFQNGMWVRVIGTADIDKVKKQVDAIIAENEKREKEFRDRMDLTDKELEAFNNKINGLNFEIDNIVIDSISPEVVMGAIKDAGFGQAVDDIKNKVNSTSDSLDTTIKLVGNNGQQTYNKNRTTLTELLIPFGVDKKTIAHNGEGFEVNQPYTVSFAARLIERGNSRVIFDFEVLP